MNRDPIFLLLPGILRPSEWGLHSQELMVSPFPFQPHSYRGEGTRAELAARKEVSWYLAMHTRACDFFFPFLLFTGAGLSW